MSITKRNIIIVICVFIGQFLIFGVGLGIGMTLSRPPSGTYFRHPHGEIPDDANSIVIDGRDMTLRVAHSHYCEYASDWVRTEYFYHGRLQFGFTGFYFNPLINGELLGRAFSMSFDRHGGRLRLDRLDDSPILTYDSPSLEVLLFILTPL